MTSTTTTNIFPCNTCELIFEGSQAQRTHMREPWHVYNLKRRIADLPPISAEIYNENVATSLFSNKQELLGNASPLSSAKISLAKAEHVEVSKDIEGSVSEQVQTTHCLFCNQNQDDLEANFEHMLSVHGLYIPDLEHLSSLETILGYLHTVITEYNECLYCGMVKQTAEAIRRHMLDKGHCMINLQREPDLVEFWEFSDSESPDTDEGEESRSKSQSQIRQPDTARFKDSSQDEYALPSGKIIGSKGKARECRLLARRTVLVAAKEISISNRLVAGDVDDETMEARTPASGSDPAVALTRSQRDSGKEEIQNRAITVRDVAGLAGVSDQQVRSLVTIQRKMQRQQAVVEASAAWADELGGRSQKHGKVKMNLRAG